MADLTREQIDWLLTDLRTRADATASVLFTLDGHAGHEFLRRATLTGATQTVWAETGPRLDALWLAFGAVQDLLTEAEAVRGGAGRLSRADVTRLSALLSAPVVPDRNGTALDAYQGAPPARCAQRLAGDGEEIQAVLDRVADRLGAVTERFATLEDTLAAARGLAGAERDVARQSAELSALRDLAIGDPLGVDLDGPRIRAVAAALDDLAGQASRRARLVAGYEARRAAIGPAIDGVRDAEQAARDAYALATEKIADPRLPPDVSATAELRSRLGTLDRLDGLALDQAIPALERAVADARAAADARCAFAVGLVARRDELRGRLEAYRMKAVRTGLGERADLPALHTRARTLLWTAPCDLPGATRAVYAYQQALFASENSGGGAA